MAGFATANCTICPINSFSTGGAANNTLECSPCPEATVTFSAGAKAATDCVGETCIWLFAAEQVWAWWLMTSLVAADQLSHHFETANNVQLRIMLSPCGCFGLLYALIFIQSVPFNTLATGEGQVHPVLNA
jgi:hypothetical protein